MLMLQQVTLDGRLDLGFTWASLPGVSCYLLVTAPLLKPTFYEASCCGLSSPGNLEGRTQKFWFLDGVFVMVGGIRNRLFKEGREVLVVWIA